MGKAHIVTRNYVRRSDIFADLFNQFLYRGRPTITPDRLRELDTAELAAPYGADGAAVPEQRYRDVAKMLAAMTDGRAAYCVLAVENESKVNYAMPVKNGLYDFLQLSWQVSETAHGPRRKSRLDFESWREIRVCVSRHLLIRISAHPCGAGIRRGSFTSPF